MSKENYYDKEDWDRYWRETAEKEFTAFAEYSRKREVEILRQETELHDEVLWVLEAGCGSATGSRFFSQNWSSRGRVGFVARKQRGS